MSISASRLRARPAGCSRPGRRSLSAGGPPRGLEKMVGFDVVHSKKAAFRPQGGGAKFGQGLLVASRGLVMWLIPGGACEWDGWFGAQGDLGPFIRLGEEMPLTTAGSVPQIRPRPPSGGNFLPASRPRSIQKNAEKSENHKVIIY